MKIRFLASPIIAAFFVLNSWAQNAPASTPPPNSFLERLTTVTDSDSIPWTAEQFATMGRIRDAAMLDPNAYNMLAHLTDNIGPRLSAHDFDSIAGAPTNLHDAWLKHSGSALNKDRLLAA